MGACSPGPESTVPHPSPSGLPLRQSRRPGAPSSCATTELSGGRAGVSPLPRRDPSSGRRRLPRRSSARSHLPAGVGASPGPPPRRPRGLRPAGRQSRGPARRPCVPAVPPAVRSPPGPRPLPCCPAQPPSTPDPEVPSPPAPGLPALKAQAPFVWAPPPPPTTTPDARPSGPTPFGGTG